MSEKKSARVCLELRHIKKDYMVDKKPFTAIHDLSCCFPQKGFIAILGHSGSGKTTLLNIIGGLDHYTDGDLLIDGKSTKDYKDRDWDNYRNRRIGFVFQTYNLIPHLNILQNVEMSLKLGGISARERERKARAVLEKVGLGEYVKKLPNQLSGGQMQRVAIARALVNDPDIILADEPTGALDSATSIQVMDLIKEVGKDRCVILVTHNRELADAYAERIIEMKDGRIIKDTAPLEPEKEPGVGESKGKRTSMSFLTALHSSAKNILTKKGRSILTAIACSFGIIGVALVLATSNGFAQYVGNVEVSIASSVPITIAPVAYKTVDLQTSLPEEYPSEKIVKVYDSSTSILTPVYNDFSQEYFEYLDRMVDDPACEAYGAAMSIMYNRDGLSYHFLGNTANGIRSIDQYSSAGSVASAISSVTSLPATIIHELYGDKDAMSKLYDTIEGRFPVEADEMALVLDRYNQIDFKTLQKLGYFDTDRQFSSLTEAEKQISFSDILYHDETNPGKIQYKAYTNSNYYQLPENPDDVPSVLKDVTIDGYDNIQFSSTGSIEDGDLSISITGDKVQKTIKSVPDAGVQAVYGDDAKYHPIKMKIVGVIRPSETSYLNLMPASLAYTHKLTEIITADIAEGTSSNELGQYQKENWLIPYNADPEKDGLQILQNTFNQTAAILNQAKSTTDVNVLTQAMSVLTSGLPNAIHTYSVTAYYSPTSVGRFTKISGYLGWCRNFGVNFKKIANYEDFFADLMSDGIEAMFDPSKGNNIMDLIAYANSYSLVSAVLIFPAALTTKETIHAYLDQWNERHPNSEVVYSDIMDTLFGSLGTMIQVISAVLIVFASISLVVSSVMTAIITYVSVIERTKEIGVLRACGARKKDVSRLFEAECVIIGFIAGAIGIGFTLVVCIPINFVLDHTFPGNGLSNIAQLSPWHALLLMAVSIALAFLSGFIPARIAAKKDPVICLRSE